LAHHIAFDTLYDTEKVASYGYQKSMNRASRVTPQITANSYRGFLRKNFASLVLNIPSRFSLAILMSIPTQTADYYFDSF